jgi:hypothetical protein
MALPATEIEFEKFIAKFEAGDFSKEEWRHPQHVAMAFWYLNCFDEVTAIKKICQGIKNLNLNHGVPQTPTGGYHETWSIFFAKILKLFVDEKLDRTLPTIEQMNLSIAFLSDFREISKRYYSRELIMSWEARTQWREPDLCRLASPL